MHRNASSYSRRGEKGKGRERKEERREDRKGEGEERERCKIGRERKGKGKRRQEKGGKERVQGKYGRSPLPAKGIRPCRNIVCHWRIRLTYFSLSATGQSPARILWLPCYAPPSSCSPGQDEIGCCLIN